MIEAYTKEKGLCIVNEKELRAIKNEKIWLDVTNISHEEVAVVGELFGLHPLSAEDLYNSPIRIKVEEFPEYLFCSFYSIEKNKKIELQEIDFVIGEKFLISNHRKIVKGISMFKKDHERIQRNFDKGLEFLFHKLLDLEVDNYAPILEKINDEVEQLEEDAGNKPEKRTLSKIIALKKVIVNIKKTTLAQREKTGYLAKNETKFLSKKSIPYFRDVYDHTIRVSDYVESLREAIGDAYNTYMSAMSNNMNEVMKTLSIIATIALPLTVISGIYGTNFTILPGQNVALGFWFMIILMIIVAGIMLAFFRKRKWF